jgi:hypothetical protein
MDKAQRRRYQYRFFADLCIEACRLQVQRIQEGGGAPRHDLDFYVLSAWRVRSTAVRVRDRLSHLDTAPIREALLRFDARVPALQGLRNWLMHPSDPGDIGDVVWFGDSIVRRLPNGEVRYLVSPEDHHPAVESLYEELTAFLGPLPAIA